MSNIVGTFRVQADTNLIEILPDPLAPNPNKSIPQKSGGDFVVLMILVNAGDVRLINNGGVIVGGGVTQAYVTLAAKTAGGADRPAGTYSYNQLRNDYRVEGAAIDITFTLVEVK